MVRTNVLLAAVCLAFVLILSDPALAADVAQGKCIDFEIGAKRITLEEYSPEMSKDYPYGKSTGRLLIFDVAGAKIGIEPQPGDVLRIAYSVEDGARRAVKVMNVSKQDLRKK